jgi:hypothetical protein
VQHTAGGLSSLMFDQLVGVKLIKFCSHFTILKKKFLSLLKLASKCVVVDDRLDQWYKSVLMMLAYVWPDEHLSQRISNNNRAS